MVRGNPSGISPDSRSLHTQQQSGYDMNNVCTFTKWEAGDTFYGPVRTNDVFFIDGPSDFYGPVVVGTPCNELPVVPATCPAFGDPTYAPTPGAAPAGNNNGDGVYWVDTSKILTGNALSGANLPTSSTPSYQPRVNLPADNTNLEPTAVASGCDYEGMTYFDFLNTGSADNGSVYVYSPRYSCRARREPPTWTLNSNCGGGNGVVQLSQRSVFYVDQANTTTANSVCLDPTSSDYTFGGLVQSNDWYTGLLAKYENPALTNWTYGSLASGASPALYNRAFACNNGDAWVGGIVNGNATVGAANNVVAYQNITYANTTYNINTGSETVSEPALPSGVTPDSLGLEPTDDVIIYHPVDCTNWDNQTNGDTCITINNPGNPVTQSVSQNATNLFGTTCGTTNSTDSGWSDAGTGQNTWQHGGTRTADWQNAAGTQNGCQINQIDAAILAFNGEYTAENYHARRRNGHDNGVWLCK